MTKRLDGTAKISYNEWDGDDRVFSFKAWENYGKSRIYMRDYKGRTIGYIDREDGHFELSDKQGLQMDLINSAIVELAKYYQMINA